MQIQVQAVSGSFILPWLTGNHGGCFLFSGIDVETTQTGGTTSHHIIFYGIN